MYQSTTTSERLRQPSCERTESKKSILSAAASPVKMCHAPALEKALRTAMGKLLDPDYGENTHALLTSLDHDGSWLKMSEGCCQQVLISDREETSELFSGTWPSRRQKISTDSTSSKMRQCSAATICRGSNKS